MEISSLANSPYPCKQWLYLESTCKANGTSEVDFLAEQQCLCDGSFWEIENACDACYFAHGYQQVTPEEASTSRSSLSAAECSPSPPFQPYSNLLPPINITSARLAPSWTLTSDGFLNNTAISVYFTPTAGATAGQITGSATGRLTGWTNYSGISYITTSVPPNNGTGTAISGSSATGSISPATAVGASSTAATASSSPGQSSNAASKGEIRWAADYW